MPAIFYLVLADVGRSSVKLRSIFRKPGWKCEQQLERVQPGAELLQPDPAAQPAGGGEEFLRVAQVGGLASGVSSRSRSPGTWCLASSRSISPASSGEPEQAGLTFTSRRMSWPARRRSPSVAMARHHPVVDGAEQVVVLGDAEEGGRQRQLVVDLHPDHRLVQLARRAQQVQHRQVVQHETVAVQRLADALDPQLDALLLGTVHRAGVVRVDRAAAEVERGAQASAAFASTGPTLAIFSPICTATDAGGDRHRTLADGEHVVGEGVAQALGGGDGMGVRAFQQHAEAVVADPRQHGIGAERGLRAQPARRPARRPNRCRSPAAGARSGRARPAAGRTAPRRG